MRVFVLLAVLLCTVAPTRAETYIFDRVVPEGATLTYSEGGRVVRVMPAPAGRVHIVVTTGDNVSIALRHGRKHR